MKGKIKYLQASVLKAMQMLDYISFLYVLAIPFTKKKNWSKPFLQLKTRCFNHL